MSKGSPVPQNVRAEDIPDVDKCSISEKCIDLIADAIPLNQTHQVKAVEPELKKVKYLYPHNVIQDFIDKESPFEYFIVFIIEWSPKCSDPVHDIDKLTKKWNDINWLGSQLSYTHIPPLGG